MAGANFFDLEDGGNPNFGDLEAQPAIISVGVNDEVTQYQNACVIQIQHYTETITTVTAGGVSCAITSQVVGQSVTVNLPGSLATGSVTFIVSGASQTASRTATMTKTHPLACPINGTTIPGISSSDPSRSLIYGVSLDLAPYASVGSLPASLQFKSPHTTWTAGNVNLPLNQVLEPSLTAVDGETVSLALSILKSDGSVTNTTLSIVVNVDDVHIIRLSAANGTQLQPISYTFPTGWIISATQTLKLQDVVLTVGEATITQENIDGGSINSLTLGEFVTVLLSDVPNNLGAICPNIEVEAA